MKKEEKSQSLLLQVFIPIDHTHGFVRGKGSQSLLLQVFIPIKFESLGVN